MSKNKDQYKEFTRRTFLLAGLNLGLFMGLGARMGYLQVIEQKKYKTLSDKNRINMRLIPAMRGEIMDRFGVPLAVNVQNFRVFMIPEQIKDIDREFDKLSKFVDLSEFDREEIKIEIKKKRAFSPVMVKDGLTWEQMASIEIHLPDLPGIFIDEGKIRYYPLGTGTAHIVGYAGLVNQSEMTDDPAMSIPGFRIGKTGIEKSYDKDLRGKVGSVQAEVNAIGREIRELEHNDAQDGDRITLTIDAELQMYCQEILSKQKSASAVVMDADTGEVYALCSSPGFDPNLFTHRITAEQWEELLSNPAVPLTNKTISGQYPPGSTFKMITALAALKEGLIDSRYKVHCPGHMNIGSGRFHCWKRAGHGSVNLVSALEQSCDVYFYDIALKIGIDKIADMAHRFGLGEKQGFDLSGELPGLIPDKEWKRGHFGERWQIGETAIAAIGQGYVQSTPLQLATMTARLVNGGNAVRPRMTQNVENGRIIRENWESLGINKEHLRLVKRGMWAVMNGSKGTAVKAQIPDKRFEMGGKTGTAQVRRITMKQRAEGLKNEDLPWSFRHHAIFVGYAPLSNPRYICSVVVEHGGGGSTTAAPIARDILWEVQKRDPKNKSVIEMIKPKRRPKRI